MQGKELVAKQLDLLVEMAEHCIIKDKPKDTVKCSDCALSWNFSLSSHGCFLVETIDNNDKFMDDLVSACIHNNLECKEKIDKIAEIFDAWE